MSLTLGEKLRQAREERGISIAEVAEQTRISPHYLEFIENDDYRTLPGGIFNKGFVKSYAKYVGIDEQEALQDYSKLLSSQDSEVSEEPKTYRPEVLTDDRSSTSFLPTLIIAAIILGLMSWGIFTLVKYVENNPNVLTTANTNSSNTNSNSANANSTNSATNTNTAAPLPSTNEIKLEFKAVGEKINVTSFVDGKKVSEDVLPEVPKTYTGQQSVKISYYRGFTPDKVQITLNGKPISAPAVAAKGRNNIEFEINKENITQILQSGQFSAPTAPSANTNTATAPR